MSVAALCARAGPRAARAARAAGTLALAALGTTGCITAEGDRGLLELVGELDLALRTVGARTVMFEPRFTLYSPYPLDGSRAYHALVEQEVALVCSLFEVEPPRPIVVLLKPTRPVQEVVVGPDGSVPAPEPAPRVEGGVGAGALRNLVLVYVEGPLRAVAAGGVAVEGWFEPEPWRGELRHELVHVASTLAGIEGGWWWSEGLAHALELAAARPGGGVEITRNEPLRDLVVGLPLPERALAAVLDADEGFSSLHPELVGVQVGARRLTTLFVEFMVEVRPEEPLLARLRAITRMERAELLALEPAFQAWLDAAAPDLAGP